MATINPYSPRPLRSGSEPLKGSYAMNRKHAIVVALLLLVLPLLALAQDDDQEGKPRTWGIYTVQESVELGGHIAGINGNQATYNTFTDVQSGPRILGENLYMTAPPDTAVLFDSLSFESFGFGGDPEDLARLRVKKQKVYNLVALYRRDKNFWDFNLFANPLANNNTAGLQNGSGEFSPFLSNSPHEQITTRQMGDLSLTLFPQSKLSFRFGISRNNNEGMIDSSLHEANEIDLSSFSRLRNDRYSIGVDYKPVERTTISFDEYFERDHLNYNWFDNPFAGFTENVGVVVTQVDPGIALQTNSNMVTSGCTIKVGALVLPGYGFLSNGTPANGFVNPACTNGTFFYNRSDVVRTRIPTEQLALQSNYWRKLDITVDGLYSSAISDVGDYNDVWSGIGSHSNARVYDITGPAKAHRITNNVDVGATYYISPSLSVSDTFRYVNWREPGGFDATEFSCYPAPIPAGSAINVTTGIGTPCGLGALIGGLPGPGLNGGTIPGSITSPAAPGTPFSNPFASFTPNIQFIGERSFWNTIRPKWQPSRRFSAYVGYRYAHRNLRELDGTGVIDDISLLGSTNATTFANAVPCVGGAVPPACNEQLVPTTFIAADTFVDSLDEHRALAGFLVRPVDAWRINADTELAYATKAFTNITPRHEQRIRLNSSYKVLRWATLNGAVHIVESRNDFATAVGGTNPATGLPAPIANLFPTVQIPGYAPAYGHKDHYRYYTWGVTLTPNSRFSSTFGLTYQDQLILSASCVPMPTATVAGVTTLAINPVTATGTASPLVTSGADPSGLCPTAEFNFATTAVAFNEPNISGGIPLTLHYHESTTSFFLNMSYKPNKRLTLLAGYDFTSDNGTNLWLRADPGHVNQPLLYAVDPLYNIVAPGAANAVGVALGPNPLVPSGTQDFFWHKPHAGLAVLVAKGVVLNGLWSYYDYAEKYGGFDPAFLQPRDFHANVGTLSLKYSF